MNPTRGEVWWAILDPVVGSEQGGRRPVLVLQNDVISSFTSTILAVSLTTNLRRAQLPSSAFVPRAGTGLAADSVALCHQLRVLDTTRFRGKIGAVASEVLLQVEYATLFALGISLRAR